VSNFVNPSSAERVSLDQVLRVAELAHLELTPDEQNEMLRDLNSIVGYVAQLNELDTTDVPAMTQVSEMLLSKPTSQNRDMGHPVEGYGGALRSDTPRASLDREVVMAEAPETDGSYFKVPRVIER
jgi:aspartyl-tRNA(Asn)/glutamyl-tRNA(Gln) amidotransferase subunit C